jgi:hypothetical protein
MGKKKPALRAGLIVKRNKRRRTICLRLLVIDSFGINRVLVANTILYGFSAHSQLQSFDIREYPLKKLGDVFLL